MRILALDPGSSCGFACGPEDGIDVSGVWLLAPARGESPGVRYLKLRAHLAAIRERFPDLALVVYEMAHHRGGAATEYAAGIATHVQSWCAEHGIEHAPAHSARVKKFATGRGNAEKQDMRRAARGRFVLRTDSDDEIDACWIYAWATATLLRGEGAPHG